MLPLSAAVTDLGAEKGLGPEACVTLGAAVGLVAVGGAPGDGLGLLAAGGALGAGLGLLAAGVALGALGTEAVLDLPAAAVLLVPEDSVKSTLLACTQICSTRLVTLQYKNKSCISKCISM